MHDPNALTGSQRLEEAVQKMDSDLPPALQKLQDTAHTTISRALALARTGRKARSGEYLAPVKVSPKTLTHEEFTEELTGRFRALQEGCKSSQD